MSTFSPNDPFYSRLPEQRPGVFQRVGDAIAGAAQAPVDLASKMKDTVSEMSEDVKGEIVRNYEEAVQRIKSIVDNTVKQLSTRATDAAQIVKDYIDVFKGEIQRLLFDENTGLFTQLKNVIYKAFYWLKVTFFTVLAIISTVTIVLIAIALHKVYKIEEVSGKLLGGLIGANISFKTLKRPASLKHTPLEKLEEK